MTALVSAVYGGFDRVHPLPEGHGFADAVLVTDVQVEVPGWRVVVEDRPGLEPRMASKAAKCMPWRYTDEPTSLWLDAAFEVAPGLAAIVDEHLADADLVAWRHPSGRLDAAQEAEFSASVPKYHRQDFAAQIASYRLAGMPDGWGLWEVGMLARRHTGPVRTQGTRWLGEILCWGVQDQVSFPYSCWTTGVRPSEWRARNRWECGWVRWHAHRDET